MQVLHNAPGRKRWISVRESETTRYLELDGCEQGAMLLDSESPVFYYLWFYKCGDLAARKDRLLILGAGAFTSAKCFALDYPEAAIDVIEEEPDLEEVGRRFFHLDQPAFQRIAFQGRTAEEFLATASQTYDVVFDDLFDGFQHVPERCRTHDHFWHLRNRLAAGGVYIKNVIWNPHIGDTRAACDEALTALKAAFPHHALIALGPPSRGHNRMLVGMTEPPPCDWSDLRGRLSDLGVPEAVFHGAQMLVKSSPG